VNEPVKHRIKGFERRERFMDAAAEIVVKDGVAAVTMDGVAERTGVARALAYRYFSDRNDLLSALFDREHAYYVQRWEASLKSDASFEDRIKGALRVWFQRADERGELFFRLSSDSGGLAEKARAIQSTNAAAWAGGLQRVYGLPAAAAKNFAWLMVAGTAGLLAARLEGCDDDQLIDDVATAIIAGAEALAHRYAGAAT
jgi:AcrR family transcriptional regulator